MRPMPELEVEEVPTDSLAPYARNAKLHTDEQVGQIAKSIEEFGFNDPIAVWDGPGGPEIVEGHGRVLAAERLGLGKVPIVRLDHLDDAQRRAYALVHNKLTMSTGWDFDALDAELEDLGDFDMGSFGFETGIEWDDGVRDLTEDTYEEPSKKVLVCPSCGHEDSAERFLSKGN